MDSYCLILEFVAGDTNFSIPSFCLIHLSNYIKESRPFIPHLGLQETNQLNKQINVSLALFFSN